MKKKIIRVLYTLFLFTSSLHAVVNWNGINVTSSVLNEDINVSGANTIQGTIQVIAMDTDIDINIVAGSSSIEGRSDTPSHLALYAAAEKTITINIDSSFSFTANGSLDFLITTEGEGDIVFVLEDGVFLLFLNAVKFFVLMNDTQTNAVTFTRKSKSASSANFMATGDSLLSFAARDEIDGNETSYGTIIFDAESLYGRMQFLLDNKACILIQGNHIPNKLQKDLTIADFDLNTPAGASATLSTKTPETLTNSASLVFLNNNKTLSDLLIDPWSTGASVAERHGFIIGPNGTLNIASSSYINYVSQGFNTCPSPSIQSDILKGRTVASLVKERNPSALTTDGDPSGIATNPTIVLNDTSALYFSANQPVGNFFTYDENDIQRGIGSIVFSVEAPTVIQGSGINKIEILSLQDSISGGSILPTSSETTFPQRTFVSNADGYRRYDSGCFFINNKLELNGTNLVHSDVNHKVYKGDDTLSEPSYIGGDSFNIAGTERPSMHFINTNILLQESAACTGLDLYIPNVDGLANSCDCTFYHNGQAIDNGSGRVLMLGTTIGSTPCDYFSPVSDSTNLVIQQTEEQATPLNQVLNFKTAANDATVNESISGNISTQYSNHQLYLGHDSALKIGSETTPAFSLTTEPTVNIAGNYISFATRGGQADIPEQSTVTGTGGIFVNDQGTLSISSGIRCLMGTMVVQQGTGSISLPNSQVYFDSRVGISHANLDMTIPASRIIIAPDETVSDYTLNWQNITKGFDSVDQPFIRYDFNAQPFANTPVTLNNIYSLPTIQGTVQQLQMRESQLGDEAHIMIDGGTVRELIFLQNASLSDIPSAVVVLQNNAKMGLGSLNTNQDSQEAATTLGINGITLIANGEAKVELNENIVVNNLCHILAGPDFGLQGNSFDENYDEQNPRAAITESLEFHSDNGKSIIIKAGGQLDLTSLTKENQHIKFSGNAQLIFEPGAQLFLDGGTIVMTDEAKIVTQVAP